MDSAGASTSAAGGGGNGGGGMAWTPPLIAGWIAGASRRYQHYLDKSTPHVLRRWLAFGAVAGAYLVRVVVLQGFYLVSYALAIYVLSLVIAFLSPQADPAFEGLGGEDDGEAGHLLPVRRSDEFRPFVRRLPEFKFWYSITKAFCIAFLMTFFVVFDVPVFWPILFFYWIMLFVLTMKRQIKHMLKYRYVPFSFGKQQYGKKPAPVDDATPAED